MLSVEFRSVWCRLSKMKRCRHYLAPIAGCQYLVVAWQLVPIISWQSTRDIKVGVISKRIFLVQGTFSSFQPRWGQSSQFIQSYKFCYVYVPKGETNSTDPSLSPSPTGVPQTSRVWTSTPGYSLKQESYLRYIGAALCSSSESNTQQPPRSR